MANLSFVSGDLYKIGDKIAEAAKTGEPEPSPEENSSPEQKLVRKPDPAMEKLLREKLAELHRLRRDVLARLEDSRSKAAAEAELLSARLDHLSKAEEVFRMVSGKMADLPEISEQDPEFSKVLAAAGRTCEEARLELIRTSALLEGSSLRNAEGGPAEKISPEQLSGSLLFRKGFSFFLPLGIVLIVCTLLLALAFVFAWKVPL